VLRDLGANEYLAFYFLFYFIFFIFVLGTGPALDLAATEYWTFYLFYFFFLDLCWGLVLRWTWRQMNIGRFMAPVVTPLAPSRMLACLVSPLLVLHFTQLMSIGTKLYSTALSP
jgi:hypothetical protein